jgi:hypothetical protein
MPAWVYFNLLPSSRFVGTLNRYQNTGYTSLKTGFFIGNEGMNKGGVESKNG